MILKRFYGVLAFAFLLMMPFTILAASFQDVPENHLNFQAIEYLKSRNIVNGYSNSDNTQISFRPENKINRVEALKIILDAFNKNSEIQDVALNFSDIDQNAWYIPYLKKSISQKIVSGYEDLTFRPGNNVNLAEALKIVAALKDIKTDDLKSEQNPFFDVEKTAWFAPYFQFAKQKHLIEPDPRGLVYPGKELTRAGLSEIVYRLLYIEEKKLSTFPLNTNWHQFENLPAYFKIKYPYGWNISEDGNRLVFWRKDEEFKQFDYIRQFPNSAAVITVLFENNEKISKKDYFDQIKSISKSYSLKTEDLKYGQTDAVRVWGESNNDFIFDLHLYLPNNKILVFYGNYGKGVRYEWNKKEILFFQDSFVYLENGGVKTEEILTKARLNIGVDEKGQDVLSMFTDLELIETDEIGVGTGPIDYYFSKSANVTLKYERSFDVVLAIEEGKTSSF